MASNADNSTALEVMRSANEDFIELIKNLRSLLSSSYATTLTMGDYTITVDSINTLITNYKSGKFNTITIGGQSSGGMQVKLSVDSVGRLRVTDSNGSLAVIDCEKLSGSYIDNSTVNEIDANQCTIRNLKGSVSVSGGNVTVDNFNVKDTLTTSSISTTTVVTESLDITGVLNCSNILSYGTRKLNVANVRNVFYRNGAPVDNAVKLIQITTDGNWILDTATGSPADFGFGTTSTTNVSVPLPGMVQLHGNNTYDQFLDKTLNVYIRAFSNLDNFRVMLNPDGNTYVPVSISDHSHLFFASLLMWPTGIVSEPADCLYLTTFKYSDLGKDIYYRTGSYPWTIYRSMTVTKEGTSYSNASFGDSYDIPAYSCIRFIANKYEIPDGSNTKIVYVLEIA